MVFIILVLSMEFAKKRCHHFVFLKRLIFSETVDHFKTQFLCHTNIMNKKIMFDDIEIDKCKLQYKKIAKY